MAKAAPKQEAPAEQPDAAKPGRKRRWLIIFLLLPLLGGGGASAWYFMQQTEHTQTAAPKEPEKPPVFLNLDSFTVNLQPEVGDQYLQVGLVVKTKDNATLDALKLQMPEIRNRTLLLLSSKRASEINTVAGKEKLSAEILAEIRKPLMPENAQQIAAVFFTSFVIQ